MISKEDKEKWTDAFRSRLESLLEEGEIDKLDSLRLKRGEKPVIHNGKIVVLRKPKGRILSGKRKH